MARKTISWGDGSGDNIYLDYNASSGDQTVTVSSDANTGLSARTKTITFATTTGSPAVTQTLTLTQASHLLLHVNKTFRGSTSDAVVTDFRLFDPSMPYWVLLYYAPDKVSSSTYMTALQCQKMVGTTRRGIWCYSTNNTAQRGIGCAAYGSPLSYVLNKRTKQMMTGSSASTFSNVTGYVFPFALMRNGSSLYYYDAGAGAWQRLFDITEHDSPLVVGARLDDSDGTTLSEPYSISSSAKLNLELHTYTQGTTEYETYRQAFYAQYE